MLMYHVTYTIYNILPGKPVDHNLGLLCLDNGLLWAILACHFGLLGIPGIYIIL